MQSNSPQKDQTKSFLTPKSKIINELSQELEAGLLNILAAPSNLIRCSLIQLLYNKVDMIDKNLLIDYVRQLIVGSENANQSNDKDVLKTRVMQNSLELQLLAGLVLKLMIDKQDNIVLYKNHEIEIILEINRNTAVLVLNNKNYDFDQTQKIFAL